MCVGGGRSVKGVGATVTAAPTLGSAPRVLSTGSALGLRGHTGEKRGDPRWTSAQKEGQTDVN